MAHFPQAVIAALLLTATLSSGCVSLGMPGLLNDTPKPADDVCQVVVTWKNYVMFTPDPTQGGQPTPGLAGRLYLFGSQIDFPRVGDGAVVVDLFDETAVARGGQPVRLEEWRIDRDTLRRLLRKDAIGHGYTLFLPWATYKPEIERVLLKLRYEPVKGHPLYAEAMPLALNEDWLPPPVANTQRIVPGAPGTPTAAMGQRR